MSDSELKGLNPPYDQIDTKKSEYLRNFLEALQTGKLKQFWPALVHEIATWRAFRSGLKEEEKPLFDKLMQYARHHGDAGSLAARPLISETIFLAVAIQQQNYLDNLQKQVDDLKKEIEKRMKE